MAEETAGCCRITPRVRASTEVVPICAYCLGTWSAIGPAARLPRPAATISAAVVTASPGLRRHGGLALPAGAVQYQVWGPAPRCSTTFQKWTGNPLVWGRRQPTASFTLAK